VIDYK